MTASAIYLVSDLHLGGDGQLSMCDYADEFIAFLQHLAETGNAATELILAGDTFNFWETTRYSGLAQLDVIIDTHPEIFAQLRRTGAVITITVMPGNHDYDLACEPAFAERLRAYNLHLDQQAAVTRAVGGRTLWLEHGQQLDRYNAAGDYGNPYALPLGYYICAMIVSGASRYSEFGSQNWLKDIRSVRVPQIPDWLLSNYFYREMRSAIRWVIAAFATIAGVALVALGAEGLRLAGLLDDNILLYNPVLDDMGPLGAALRLVLVICMALLGAMLVAGAPLYVVMRKVRTTIQRFQRINNDPDHTPLGSPKPYIAHARALFARRPDVAVYAYGHTHNAFLEPMPGGRAVINLGTWVKVLRRVPARLRLLPAVYVPSFRLTAFRLSPAADGGVVIRHLRIPKAPPRELTPLQRLVTLGRRGEPADTIPRETYLPPA